MSEEPKLARRGTRGPLPTVTQEQKRERKRVYMAERRATERREMGKLRQSATEAARKAAVDRLIGDFPERFATYLREERDRRGVRDRVYEKKRPREDVA